MKKILSVDDTVTIRRLIAHVLTDQGFAVDEAEDGRVGLEKARASRYDLILTDYNMPNMDGISMLRAIRALPEHAATPIVVITTEFGADLKQQGRDAGATGWMVKPILPGKLVEMVRRLIA
jgi:two-component system, chemotaxis family, chemotaxis protein CheY